MKKCLHLSLSSVFMFNIFFLIIENFPKLGVLDSLNILNNSILHCELESNFHIFSLIRSLGQIENQTILLTFNQSQLFLPKFRKIISFYLFHNLWDHQCYLFMPKAYNFNSAVFSFNANEIFVDWVRIFHRNCYFA